MITKVIKTKNFVNFGNFVQLPEIMFIHWEVERKYLNNGVLNILL